MRRGTSGEVGSLLGVEHSRTLRLRRPGACSSLILLLFSGVTNSPLVCLVRALASGLSDNKNRTVPDGLLRSDVTRSDSMQSTWASVSVEGVLCEMSQRSLITFVDSSCKYEPALVRSDDSPQHE